MKSHTIKISQSPRFNSSAQFFAENFNFNQQLQQSTLQLKNQQRKQKSELSTLTERIKTFKLSDKIQLQTSPTQRIQKEVEQLLGEKLIKSQSNKTVIPSYIPNLVDEQNKGSQNGLPLIEKELKTEFSEMMNQKYQQILIEQQTKSSKDFQKQKVFKNFIFSDHDIKGKEGIDNYFINQDFSHGRALITKKSKRKSDTLIKAQSEVCLKQSDNSQTNNYQEQFTHSITLTNRNNNSVSMFQNQQGSIQKNTSQFWKVRQSAVIKNISQQGQSSPTLNQLNKIHKSAIDSFNNSQPNTTKVLKRFNFEEMNVKIPPQQNLAKQKDNEILFFSESPTKFKKIVKLINTDAKKDVIDYRKVSPSLSISQKIQISSQYELSRPTTLFDLNTLSPDSPLLSQSKLSPLQKKSSRNIQKVQSSPFLMPLTFSPTAQHHPNSFTPKQQQSPINFTQALNYPSNQEISPISQSSQKKTPFKLILNKSNHQLMQPQTSIDSDRNQQVKQSEEGNGILGQFLNLQKVQSLAEQQNMTTSFNKNQNNSQQAQTPSTQTASFFQKSPLLSYTTETQQLTPQIKKQTPNFSIQKIDSLAFIDSPLFNSQPLKFQKSIIIEEELNLNNDTSPRSPKIQERKKDRKTSMMKDSTEREFKRKESICKESLSPVYRKNYRKLKSMTDDSLILDSISQTSSPLTLSSKLRAREASFVIESRMEEIKQHLLTEFSKEKELISVVEDFCLIKSHEFINEIIRFLKFSIESYNKRKLIENQHIMQQQSNSPSEKINNSHNIETCGHHHHHHHLMIDQDQLNTTMKFQIIPKILLDWVIHQIFQKMKSYKIDGDNLFAYLVELAISHLLPHNLYEELGSEKGIKNWICRIIEKLDQIISLDVDQVYQKLDEIYQIVVSIIHNNFINLENIYSLFSIKQKFTSIEFYLLKKVFIDSFSSPLSKINQTKSFKGNQTICQLIDYYSINAGKEMEQIVQQDGYVNSYIKNEILGRIEICRNILQNRCSPLLEEQIIIQISICLNNQNQFNKQRKSNTHNIKTTEQFVTELCQVFYQTKEKRQMFLTQQKNKFVDQFDSQFWQYINNSFEKVMGNKKNEELNNKCLQIDINLQLYQLEIESYQLEKDYKSVFDYIENIQQLNSDLFNWVEEIYFNHGEEFPVDVIQGFDKNFMSFFLETALSQGSYSASDIQQAAGYHKVNKDLFIFWMKGLAQVIKSNKYQLSSQQQRDLIAFLFNIVPPF